MANKLTLVFLKNVQSVLNLLLALVLLVLFVPILSVFWLLNELVRLVIITPLLRLSTGGRVRLVSEGADNVWCFKKFGNSRNMLVLTVYNARIDPKEYAKNFNSRVINYIDFETGRRPYEKLKKIYTTKFGYNCWKRAEDFDIHNHIKVVNESGNNRDEGQILSESNVFKVLGQLTEDMDETKPQWEDVIIREFVYDHEVEELDSDGRVVKLKPGTVIKSARVFRCHHALMDGASFLLMTSVMSDGEFPFSADPKTPLIKNKWTRVFVYVYCALFSIKTILSTILVAMFVKNRFVTRKFAGISHHQWSEPIQVSTLREIKNISGSSVPTVLASAVAGALRKLDEKYPLLAVSKRAFESSSSSEDDLTKQMEVFAKPEDEVLMGMIGAVLPYKDMTPRNRYTVVNFRANTSPCSRMERLETMKRTMRDLASSADFYVNLWLFQIFGKFPAFHVQNMMKNGGSPVVISNTPWARKEVKLLGDTVEEIGAWVPLLAFSGLGILITRYCESVRVCGVAEEACLSEEQLRFVIGEIQNEITMLSQECAATKKILNPLDILQNKL